MKKLRMEQARQHTVEMEDKFNNEILRCCRLTKRYVTDHIFAPVKKRFDKTDVKLIDTDSVSAILKYSSHAKKTAVLNFASYKNPGGMFLQGSKAQEECLCHESFLYNVLREYELEYYNWNRVHLNKALYLNRALYSPDVIFERGEYRSKCDVITCAAPNFGTYSRYNKDLELNYVYLRDRIHFILKIAAENKVDTLILGAFGCGVFKQDPEQVALIFDEFLSTDFENVFETVIFAIPDRNSKNYKAFEKVFK